MKARLMALLALLLFPALSFAVEVFAPKLVELKLSLGRAKAPDLKAWNAQLLTLPEGPQRQALELALRVSALAPKEAGRALSAMPLTPEALVAVSQIAARSWAAEALNARPADFQTGRSIPGSAKALQQLRGTLKNWAKQPESVDEAAAVWAGTVDRSAPRAKPLRRGARKTIAAHVFDIDDNIFMKLPTKIILFRKDSGAEFPISTDEYALVRGEIGADMEIELGGRRVNLAEYEKRDESFRETLDPPGENGFIGAVQWLVDNLPASEWQGPSWNAFVQALSDADTARHVYILTARKHKPESFREAFAFLKERGYIKNLPALANINAVGGGVTTDTAGAKAEVVKLILDRAQATPIGRGARLSIDQDGDGKKRLHSLGFSDDDRENFERMASELSAVLRVSPGRWNKVKITLYYTGKGHKYTIVLTARGGRRTQRVTERGESRR